MLFPESPNGHSILTEAELHQLDEKGWVMLSELAISEELYQSMRLKGAGIEFSLAYIHSENEKSLLQPIRNDFTQWIDSSTIQAAEVHWLAYLERVRLSLKKYFLISLTHVETQYAYYPVHHFYKRHSDQKKTNNCRFFSMVCYLNKDWKQHEGGQLVGYDNEKVIFNVAPNLGSIVLFKSEIEHEVLVSHRDRYSIAAWFRTDL